MYLRKTTSRGHDYYQICETDSGTTKVLLHLGSLPSIIKKFQYIEELENNVSLLKQAISQYGEGLNQVQNNVGNQLKNDDNE